MLRINDLVRKDPNGGGYVFRPVWDPGFEHLTPVQKRRLDVTDADVTAK